MASWGDDSIRVRMFKAALGICKHYCEASANEATELSLTDSFDRLCKRWELIKGPEIDTKGCLATMQAELAMESDLLLKTMAERLSRRFDPGVRLQQLNRIAFRQARRCVAAWGGKKAGARLEALKLLPLHCESSNRDRTELFFDREERSIRIAVGSAKHVLEDCMLLEFSLFHEYLSHAFPDWTEDQSTLSEQWLFALEVEWFATHYTAFDSTLLANVWQPPRLGDAFRAAQWMLRRCTNQCVHKFLLDWAATWSSNAEELNLDLLVQLQGVMKKAATRLGNSATPRLAKRLNALEMILCEPCATEAWDHASMAVQLGAALAL